MTTIELPAERKHLRLKGYDYSQTGAYFLTIGTHRMKCRFGHIVNDAMVLNHAGRAVEQTWLAIPEHFPRVILDEFVVMPNHVHGIVILLPEHRDTMPGEFSSSAVWPSAMSPSTNGLPQRGPKRGSIAAIVGAFKSAATRSINQDGGAGDAMNWHRNFYEHVICDEESLLRIRGYIRTNPLHWAKDRFNSAMRNM